MGQTPIYALPYPETTDPADGHGNFLALCNRIEAVLQAQAIVPVGAIVDWAYASGGIPSWALLCYGQAISRTSYAALNTLASAAGYPHGVGDGSTTFALPDLRGRQLVGKDDMGGTAAGRVTAAISGVAGTVLGAVLGSEGVTLTSAQMPAHNHGVSGATDSQGSHSHTGVTGGNTATTDAQGYHSHGGATGGRSAAHNHTYPQSTVQNDANGGYASGAIWKGQIAVRVNTAGAVNYSVTTDAETQDHTHAIAGDGSHSHNVSNHQHAISADGAHAHNFNVNSATVGGGGAHANMGPTLIANKMIRAL